MTRRNTASRRIAVLQALTKPLPGKTTYAVHVASTTAQDVDTIYFSWPTALFGRYDVLHVHWPEYLIRGKGRKQRLLNVVRFPALLARLALTRTPIVRTLHNVAPHEQGGRLERVYLGWLNARTSYFIRLNATTAVPQGRPATTILHGHYIEQFAEHPTSRLERGRILYFGLIRPYKGVEDLIGAYRGDADTSLRIVGRPNQQRLVDLVQAAAESDATISHRLEFVPDEDLVDEVTRSQLVVLPYREMHNSGSVLVALSLGRPVLVPRSAVNEALSAEVGEGWVTMFDGALTSEILYTALDRIQADPPTSPPQLDQRDWDNVGRRHVAVYRELVGTR